MMLKLPFPKVEGRKICNRDRKTGSISNLLKRQYHSRTDAGAATTLSSKTTEELRLRLHPADCPTKLLEKP